MLQCKLYNILVTSQLIPYVSRKTTTKKKHHYNDVKSSKKSQAKKIIKNLGLSVTIRLAMFIMDASVAH